MRHSKFSSINCVLIFSVVVYFTSCSKESASPSPAPVDACAGKTIVVTATPAASSPCGAANGSISVAATGSTGFTYKLNSGGAYQASGLFSNVSAGTYTVFAKDAEGCEKSSSVTVAASGTAGTLFTAVKNLIASQCQSCHNNSIQNGGMNWAVECNIIQFQNRIKVRAVDEGTMPQGGPALTPAEKAVITNWINAGGRFTD
jgi:hypothetical protein